MLHILNPTHYRTQLSYMYTNYNTYGNHVASFPLRIRIQFGYNGNCGTHNRLWDLQWGEWSVVLSLIR